jgi:hypothetical protein
MGVEQKRWRKLPTFPTLIIIIEQQTTGGKLSYYLTETTFCHDRIIQKHRGKHKLNNETKRNEKKTRMWWNRKKGGKQNQRICHHHVALVLLQRPLPPTDQTNVKNIFPRQPTSKNGFRCPRINVIMQRYSPKQQQQHPLSFHVHHHDKIPSVLHSQHPSHPSHGTHPVHVPLHRPSSPPLSAHHDLLLPRVHGSEIDVVHVYYSA